MKHAAVLTALALVTIVGCGQSTPSPTQASDELLDLLSVTEWNISHYAGTSMTVEGSSPDVGSITFPVTAKTRLVTQVSGVSRVVIIYVIDDSGVGSTVIKTDDETDGLRLGDVSSGTLYRYNDSKVITLADAGK